MSVQLQETCPDDFEQSVLTVVDIERYIIDPVFLQQTGLSDVKTSDAYDITVADTQHRYKLVLSCSLNHLVQKRKIRTGSQIRLDSVNVRFDETRLNGGGIPMVEKLTVIDEHQVADVDDLSRLPYTSKVLGHREDSHPLASFRGYYLDVWCSAEVAKTSDSVQVQACSSLGDVTSSDLYSLQEVANRWESVRASKPRLLLRVMRRSKLLHYARTSKADKWPFQLHLVVGDESGCCVAVFWNMLAPRYLNHLQEGSVVLLRNFTVKPRFKMTGHCVWHPQGLAWYDVDINVNAHNPQGEVTLLHETALDALLDTDLPLPVSNFASRRQLSCLPDGYVCDVAGVVTFVGAIQREKSKGKAGWDSGLFWVKRWLHIQDHSSQRPIVVQLYRGVQGEEFEDSLAVGLFLVCRNMRVVQGLENVLSSRQHRHAFVTSTRETQIYIHEADEPAEFPFADDAVLRSAQRFASCTDCGITQEGLLGKMFFSFPPRPISLDSFRSQLDHLEVDVEKTLIPSDGWQTFVENLSYRETTQMAVQARLIAMEFHRKQKSTRRSKRKQGIQPQVTNASGSADEDLIHLGYNPMTENSGSAVSLEGESFFTLQWHGLNARVILTSLKACNLHSCPPDLTLHNFLSGACDALPWETTVNMRASVADRLIESVSPRSVASLPRYLVLLDVHCIDGQVAVMGVNRAFPLVETT